MGYLKSSSLPVYLTLSALWLSILPIAFAQESNDDLVEQARAAYRNRHRKGQAKLAFDYYEKASKASPSYTVFWEGARAASYLGQKAWAKAARNKRQELYTKGLDWAERAVATKSKGAEGHFYVAVLTGLLAQEKTFLHQMASARDIRLAAERALKLDPSVECGGPPRLLGLYYRHLPEAFGGENTKARKFMEQAIKHCPGDVSLHYALAECLHELGEEKLARAKAQWVLDHPPRDARERAEYKNVKQKTLELIEEME